MSLHNPDFIRVLYPGMKHITIEMFGIHMSAEVFRNLVESNEKLWNDGLFERNFIKIFTKDYGRSC